MRLSEIGQKEIVDFDRGERLGVLGQTDLLIDEKEGKVQALIIPSLKWFGLSKRGSDLTVPWNQIKKVGKDMIIIDVDNHDSLY
ncbi:YlmC/YmxH family sporulation protein [Paenalkalicoccus suaedae]|uniref:YlmC/YmxH family sporulation protein n=1 Tax=Paenalkalicoccus suaedae TaxID=2592382 RepID=A0A859FGN9_9BACI|nr:YlmC/YmxH family sporulation protein [Paenalkalicoccus suaedae]QKS71386.1 YlmC/YmxH family sporulation protein [Paenalkalicoccus suaedae]